MSENSTPQVVVPPEAREKLSKARTLIQTFWPFLTAAAYRLVPRWSAEPGLTLAVDRHWRLYLNPDYVGKLTTPELALLIAGHEVQHALMKHCDRCVEYRGVMISDGKGPGVSLANVAHDLAINSSIRTFAECGLRYRQSIGKTSAVTQLKAPQTILYPEQFKTRDGKPFPNGLVSEAYAKLLEESIPKGKSPNPLSGTAGAAGSGMCGSGGGGPKAPWEDPSSPDAGDAESGVTEEEQDVLRKAVAQAAKEQAAKSRGSVPGDLELWAEAELTPPKADWRKELKKEVRSGVNWSIGRVDVSYNRPHRRSIASQSRVVFPGHQAPTPRIAIIMDCSGSMGPKDYSYAFSECKGILQACGLQKVPVLVVDAAVHRIQWVSSIEEIEMKGGGGTHMGVGVEAAVELGVNLVICTTDGLTPWCADPGPGVRVIVVLTQPENSGYPTPEWAKVIDAYD